MTTIVAALYRFTPIADPAVLRDTLKVAFTELALCGTLLIAPEGINGTLAGQADAIEQMLGLLAEHTGLPKDDVKFSSAPGKPFNRLKIRMKREIVTFNQPQADPGRLGGTYVTPQDWNALIADPDIVVVDARNVYETKIGMFDGAQDPGTQHFTEFADYVRANLDPAKHKKIAMYCTGGIRCEKASAFMRAEGFDEVYHLKGGILKYLEDVPAEQSKWRGDCYVFDKRMAVGHGLVPGNYSMCFGCGYPVTEGDKTHAHYEEGVSCPTCYTWSSGEDKKRFRTRQMQSVKGKPEDSIAI